MKKHIHILGICGTFMGGIALIARQMGFSVTGSDQNIYPPMSFILASQGIEIMSGYYKEHLRPRPDLVLFGNVCKRGNEAVEYVLNEDIPYDSGPGWLATHFLKKRHVLAVAGTHGKTTTTSILAWILTYAGLKPGYLIGGAAQNFPYTADIGESPYFVIEADEYDTAFFDKRPKFLHYCPKTLILNNLEFDHADIYQDLRAIQHQFHLLIRTVPGKGRIFYPGADANLAEVLTRGVWSETEIFSGLKSDWHIQLQKEDGSEFEVYYKNQFCGQVIWNLWGEHNITNALAAIAAAAHVGVEPSQSIAALKEFQGVKRRLEKTAEINGITIYDDFAHHPTAIEKTLHALRTRVGRQRIFAVLQFASNTMRNGGHSEEHIAKSLVNADQIILLNSELNDVNLSSICNKINSPTYIFQNVDDIVKYLHKHLKAEDKVLIMSNKGFDGLQQKLVKTLELRD